MSEATTLNWDAIARRYNLDEQAEWRKLLEHFDLAAGFSFVVLLIPDADGAALCRRELEELLQKEGRHLYPIELQKPQDLRRLPEHFLDVPIHADTACVWLSAIAPDYTPDYQSWRDAWEHALGRLNAHRNPIRDHFTCSLVFVGAPWLQEAMREIAPDLWSVRTLVVRIETTALSSGETNTLRPTEAAAADGPDPDFALQQAEKLRGVAGKELMLAELLHRAGEGFENRNQWQEAVTTYTEALQLKQRHKAPYKSLLNTFHRLAWAYLVVGQAKRALHFSEQALMLSHENGDEDGEAFALSNMGQAYQTLGEPRRATECHEKALHIAQNIGNEGGESVTLSNLGNTYEVLGETRRAIDCYERALHITRAIGSRRVEGVNLGNLGNAYLSLGEIQHAIDYYEQALMIASDIGDRHNESVHLNNLGNAYLSSGEIQRAIDYFEQALVIARDIGARRTEGATLGSLGTAYTALGETQQAVNYYEQRLEIARETNDRRGEGNALSNMSCVLYQLGNRAQAVKLASDALKIFEQIEAPNAAEVRQRLEEWRVEAA